MNVFSGSHKTSSTRLDGGAKKATATTATAVSERMQTNWLYMRAQECTLFAPIAVGCWRLD